MDNMHTKTVLVTGAGGFLGKFFIERLIDSTDYGIVAVTSRSSLDVRKNARLAMVDSGDWDRIAGEMSKADIVINCAFPRNVDGVAMAKGLNYIDRILSLAGDNENCAVVNISSQSVYSQKDPKPANEDNEVCLESSYAVAKYATELLLDARCPKNARTNVRLASLIGPGFDQRVVNKMVMKVLRGEALTVLENGSSFGYLDVCDAAEALTLLCREESCADWERVYNLGSDRSYSLTEIAQSVLRVCGERSGGLIKSNLKIEASEHLCTYSRLDSSRFRIMTGWRNRISLRESIEAIVSDAMRSDEAATNYPIS